MFYYYEMLIVWLNVCVCVCVLLQQKNKKVNVKYSSNTSPSLNSIKNYDDCVGGVVVGSNFMKNFHHINNAPCSSASTCTSASTTFASLSSFNNTTSTANLNKSISLNNATSTNSRPAKSYVYIQEVWYGIV